MDMKEHRFNLLTLLLTFNINEEWKRCDKIIKALLASIAPDSLVKKELDEYIKNKKLTYLDEKKLIDVMMDKQENPFQKDNIAQLIVPLDDWYYSAIYDKFMVIFSKENLINK
jgi:hypothetical protein